MISLRARFASALVAASLAGALAVALPAPLAAQVQAPPMPAASPPPPAPVEAPRLLAPPANAVAQCGDFTFVVAPAKPAECASRGGLKVVLPGGRTTTAPAPAAAPDARATAPQPASTRRDDVPPVDATMRCRDGSWLTGAPSASRCDRNGGLAVILPSTPPAPPRTP